MVRDHPTLLEKKEKTFLKLLTQKMADPQLHTGYCYYQKLPSGYD
jgi:hypothetical protein